MAPPPGIAPTVTRSFRGRAKATTPATTPAPSVAVLTHANVRAREASLTPVGSAQKPVDPLHFCPALSCADQAMPPVTALAARDATATVPST